MRILTIGTFLFVYFIFFGMEGYTCKMRSKYVVSTATDASLRGPPDTRHNFNEVSNEIQSTIKVRRSVTSHIGFMRSPVRSPVEPNHSINAGPSFKVIYSSGKPRFPNTETPVLEFDSNKYRCNDTASSHCMALTLMFRNLVQKEFHRVLMSQSKVFSSGLEVHNIYNVQFDGAKGMQKTRDEIICQLHAVSVQTLSALDEMFAGEGLEGAAEPLRGNRVYGTCAVVTSAGALLGSQLGTFIDSHDMVVRFNNAPTTNYAGDVGSRTTFRVLNSQVVTNPKFNFFEDPIYDNVSIIIWDPAQFTTTLEEGFQQPNLPLFDAYKKFLKLKPGADVHILKPHIQWSLWSLLQQSTEYRLRKNPPSSGFIGLWFALSRCELVRVVQYVPSTRITKRCHYYGDENDSECTTGSWHPLAQEKYLAYLMRSNSDFQIFQNGWVEIATDVSCPE